MPSTQSVREVTCAHCGKPFRAQILAPDTARRGVKCPHCRLFMPLERVEPDEDAA